MALKRKIVVVTGDSIAQDLSETVFNNAASMAGIRVSFNNQHGETRHVEMDCIVELVNTAMGGHTIEMISSRFYRDAVMFNPEIVIVNGGTNDLWGNYLSEASFKTFWKSILDMCRENGITAVVFGIAPASGFPDDLMRKRDIWNTDLEKLVSKYDGFIFVDVDSYVGMYREGGGRDNLWDIKPEYDMDGVHFSRAGSEKIAHAILDAMSHLLV
ncbi:hypothetical protein KKB99_04400 [bacterium]|nr:hypothetical protein [bacterium]MBU1025235.1 hypothetical protein [bacterium]